MRLQKTINNALFSTAFMLLSTLLSFGYRTIFINVLGVEYLGISAFFLNILMMLSLGELGIGQAISFSLYKPLLNNDKKKINALMNFYKKAYFIIGLIILLFAVLFSPFIHYFLKTSVNPLDVYIIFSLYVAQSSLSYFWGYKRTLLIADQLAYKIVPITAISKILEVISMILILVITKSFIFTLTIQLIVKLLENIIVNYYIDKKYKYLGNKTESIDDKELRIIKKNVKAMLFHKLGDFSVNGTDNIIISTFIGITVLGIYSNYAMLISMVLSFLVVIFNSAGASFGSIIAEGNIYESERKFRVFNLLGYWLFGFSSISLYVLLDPFITVWIGNKYLMTSSVVILISLNFFISGIRIPIGIVKSSGGIYSQDKYLPIIQGVINLILSLIFVNLWGVEGVLIATLLSSIIAPNWYRPYIVYKFLFKSSSIYYFKTLLSWCFVVILTAVITKTATEYIVLSENHICKLIKDVLICIFIPNFIFYLVVSKTTDFKNLLNMISRKQLE
ncbi:lipopolysaccharide biosynthesis protein [Photobacterium phosphoreum]|uniref:lipopolysaccharide biosynthesis protein n=1 Tax=Photobacterium phosphoreum TaxID=659 RepID=UPI000D1809A1|nr:oligosaccharide flippase family protein [Photobacterium phosphoreum]PSU31834.1 teichoic acid transporter [Photobacterium phosphoreum]